jgi:hypothetical protein
VERDVKMEAELKNTNELADDDNTRSTNEELVEFR